ncbi:glycosyltransferase family 4 protein [Sinomonas atrocyanea]
MERMLESAAEHMLQEIDSIIVGFGSHHPFEMPLRIAGYDVRTFAPLTKFKALKEFVKFVRRREVDVYHIHSERLYVFLVLLLNAVRAKPIIVRTFHSMFSVSGWKSKVKALANRIVDRRVAALVSCSPEVQDFEAARGRQSTLIWNWVDEKYFGHGPERDAPLVRDLLIVGNCSSIKNHEVVLTAVLGEGINARRVLHVGREEGASSPEVGLLDSLEQVSRLGHRGPADPIQLMESGPVFAISSTREGMSVALAEAIVSGLPCLVSDSPGLHWAARFANVKFVDATDTLAWRRALDAFDGVAIESRNDATHMFRPGVGAARYLSLYREVMVGVL